MSNMTKPPKRQLAYVADLNKCIGCQTCTVACKTLWTSGPGQDYMYWRNVETAPGLGYPRNWQSKGGGYKDGVLQKGKIPPMIDYGVPFEFDYAGRLFEGKKEERDRVRRLGLLPIGMRIRERANIPTTPFSMCRGCATTAPSRHVLKPARMKRYTSASKTAWW